VFWAVLLPLSPNAQSYVNGGVPPETSTLKLTSSAVVGLFVEAVGVKTSWGFTMIPIEALVGAPTASVAVNVTVNLPGRP
jgi:hypothetical protein